MEKIVNKITQKWDSIYKSNNYAFGTTPNVYFKLFLNKYKPSGDIILPGDGEGRNSVFAAKFGLKVFAFDLSIQGKEKALRLAERNKVDIQYEIGDFLKMEIKENSFDVAALIYTHFHPKIRSAYHQKISNILKINGWLIIEGFSINNPNTIKQDSEVCYENFSKFYSIDDIKKDFPNFDIFELNEEKIELHEGIYHKGTASVIRYVGKKKV